MCLTVFILLCDRGRQGSVLKRTKNDNFQVFLAVWVFFLRFLGRLRGGLCQNCMKQYECHMYFPSLFFSFSFMIKIGKEECSILRKKLNFKYFYTLGQVKKWLMLKLDKIKTAKLSCVSNCFYLALWSRSAVRSSQTSEKRSILSIFGSGSFSPKFWTGHGVAYISIAWNNKNVACNCMANGFYFLVDVGREKL